MWPLPLSACRALFTWQRHLCGHAPPSLCSAGRLPTTWYKNSYVSLDMANMKMSAGPGTYPGRTHRYWKGAAPLFPFGHGLSYTTWALTAPSLAAAWPPGATATVTLTNTGTVASAHTVLLFMSYSGTADPATPPLPTLTLAGTGCTAAGTTSLVQTLVAWRRTAGKVAPGGAISLTFSLTYARQGFASSWAGFGDPVPPCGVYSLRLNRLTADLPADLRLRLAP